MAPYVGYARVPTVAGPVDLDWSLDALADLDQFAAFLHEQFPELAARSVAHTCFGIGTTAPRF